MPYKVKASNREVLQFIHGKQAIEVWQLCEKFHFSDGAARNKLTKLKKKGLVFNVPGHLWLLTVEGEGRVAYYVKGDGRRNIGLSHA